MLNGVAADTVCEPRDCQEAVRSTVINEGPLPLGWGTPQTVSLVTSADQGSICMGSGRWLQPRAFGHALQGGTCPSGGADGPQIPLPQLTGSQSCAAPRWPRRPPEGTAGRRQATWAFQPHPKAATVWAAARWAPGSTCPGAIVYLRAGCPPCPSTPWNVTREHRGLTRWFTLPLS